MSDAEIRQPGACLQDDGSLRQLSVPELLLERLASAVERIADYLAQNREAQSAASLPTIQFPVTETSGTSFKAGPNPAGNADDASRCGVCLTRCEEQWALLDCGHFPCCAQCLRNLDNMHAGQIR